MYKLSEKSLENLEQCHIDLQKIAHELIKYRDITIICGRRNKIDQDIAYAKGNSKVKFPNSKHNSNPSMAFDIAFYPIEWTNHKDWIELGRLVTEIANKLGIKIRWGGNFKTLKDYPHFELVE